MKLLFDSNVLISAWVAHGLCRDLVRLAAGLHDLSIITLCYCPTLEREVLGHLRGKFGASEQQCAVAHDFFHAIESVADGHEWLPPTDFPDLDDAPIVGAALAAGADLFVTGDKALLALDAVEGLPIRSPRDAFIRLRGLPGGH